jgi:hypothetical protein
VSTHYSYWLHRVCALFLAATISCAGFSVSARVWKPGPDKLARDYATINDVKPNGDLILLTWFAPAMIQSDAPGAAAIKAILEKYIVIMVVHGHFDKTTISYAFDEIDQLAAKDQDQRALTLVSKENLPPATVAILSGVEAMLRQMAGAMGKGTKVFVFDAGALSSCKKGELIIPFAGETYTWATPMPGCPAS